MTDETHIELAPQPDPLGNAAAVVDVLALLRLITDADASAKRLAELREAKRAADDQLMALSRRETEAAKRENALASREREADRREVENTRRAAELDQLSADLDEYAERLRRAKNDLGIRSAQVELIVERLGPRFATLLTPVEIPEEVPSTHGRQPGSQRTQFRKADNAGAAS